MKKNILFCTLFISILSFSQVKYEKAYFISNSDNRIECLIKNLDWKNSPNSFEYKVNEEDKPILKSINDVKLFEIYNQAKYLRSNVKIDQSSNNVNQLSDIRDPEFIEKVVFLKELASGDINLYNYIDGNLTRYFYQIGNGNLEPLIYKPYELDGGRMVYNEDYKKQLEKILVCSSINSKEIYEAEYKEKNLKELYSKYYKCINPNYEDKITKQKKGKFNLNIRPRINFSSANFSNLKSNINSGMDNKIGFGFGIEAEYIFPFNKNKWSLIMEPTYQSYKSEKTTNVNYLVGGELITNINYKSIELPIGIRHYMFLSDKSKIFINAQYVLDLVMSKSSIEFKRNDNSLFNSLEIKSKPNFAVGIGYSYKNKYGIEAKFYTNRDILSDYSYWQSKYKNISLIFSYNIF